MVVEFSRETCLIFHKNTLHFYSFSHALAYKFIDIKFGQVGTTPSEFDKSNKKS